MLAHPYKVRRWPTFGDGVLHAVTNMGEAKRRPRVAVEVIAKEHTETLSQVPCRCENGSFSFRESRIAPGGGEIRSRNVATLTESRGRIRPLPGCGSNTHLWTGGGRRVTAPNGCFQAC